MRFGSIESRMEQRVGRIAGCDAMESKLRLNYEFAPVHELSKPLIMLFHFLSRTTKLIAAFVTHVRRCRTPP